MDQTIVNVNTFAPDKKGKALASFILGIVSTIAWLIPIFGAPISIVGLIMGILGVKSSKKWMAVVGIALCGITLIAAVINGVLGAMMAINTINELSK